MGFFSTIGVLSQQTSFEKEMDAIKAKYRKIKAEIQNTDEYGRSLKIEQVKKQESVETLDAKNASMEELVALFKEFENRMKG